eukprot:7089352-Prymnesium_polylepis.1
MHDRHSHAFCDAHPRGPRAARTQGCTHSVGPFPIMYSQDACAGYRVLGGTVARVTPLSAGNFEQSDASYILTPPETAEKH